MERGIIRYPSPVTFQGNDIRIIRDMEIKKFGKELRNFIGLDEFEEVD